MTIIDRILAKTQQDPLSDCLIWTGAASKTHTILRPRVTSVECSTHTVNDYPMIRYENTTVHPVRVILAHKLGLTELPRLRRLCANPLCVNDLHYEVRQSGPGQKHRVTPDIIFAITGVTVTQAHIDSALSGAAPAPPSTQDVQQALRDLELMYPPSPEEASEWTGLTITQADIDLHFQQRHFDAPLSHSR